MLRVTKTIAAVSLSLVAAASFAKAPSHLVSHNHIDVSSQSFMKSHPGDDSFSISNPATQPGKTKKVSWITVSMICSGQESSCPAKIVVNTTPVTELGVAYMNVSTGKITPEVLSNNGYTMRVIGLGEVEFVKD